MAMNKTSKTRKIRRSGWESSVYGKDDFGILDKELWARIREIAIERDNNRCQSCYHKLSSKRLTVHHIIRRDEGGKDDPNNLICLCYQCHDEIEPFGFRTLAEIQGYKKDPKEAKKRAQAAKSKEMEELLSRIDANRPAWHRNVYGGGKGIGE